MTNEIQSVRTITTTILQSLVSLPEHQLCCLSRFSADGYWQKIFALAQLHLQLQPERTASPPPDPKHIQSSGALVFLNTLLIQNLSEGFWAIPTAIINNLQKGRLSLGKASKPLSLSFWSKLSIATTNIFWSRPEQTGRRKSNRDNSDTATHALCFNLE